MTQGESAGFWSTRTAWARSLRTPFRDFLHTETGSAVVLLAATLAALVWANLDPSSYERCGKRICRYDSVTRA